jgi:site-specific DNA-methyltransferase (adenine-specific)
MDCIKGMKAMPDESVDVVITSPPYNLGIQYTNYNDSRNRNEYLDWSRDWAAEVKRLLREDGSFFFNLGACPSNPLIPHMLIVAMMDLGFVLQNTFHWIKSITIKTKDGQEISAGHFKPIQSKRFVNDCHEYIFHLTKHGTTPIDRLGVGVKYMDKSNIKRWSHTGGRDRRCRGNNWFIPYTTIVNRSKERPHPATFPTELAENCLRIHGCRPDLVVMDPFLGIGHSALAAKLCRVGQFIGFEIDPEYVAVARNALVTGVLGPTDKLRERAAGDRRRGGKVEATLFDPPPKPDPATTG